MRLKINYPCSRIDNLLHQTKQNHINFVHFPKVGGKSIRKKLEEDLTNSTFFYYNNPLKKNIIQRKIAKLKNQKYYKKQRIVYGHFSIDDALISAKNSYNIVCLREPIDWFGSMYFYQKDKYGYDIDPVQFCKKYNLNNAYSQFVGSNLLKTFSLIGRFEEYDNFLMSLSNILEMDFKVNKDNITRNKPDNYNEYFKDMNVLVPLKNLMHENQKIYDLIK